MCAAGVYLIGRLPASVFREGYLPTMRELVGSQQLDNRQEEMSELFARALASKVSAVRLLFFWYDIEHYHKSSTVLYFFQL